MPAKRQRDAAPPPAGRAAGLWQWLQQHGAGLDGIEISDSYGDGGLGLFATRHFALGAPIGFLPRRCILDPIAVLAEDPLAVEAQRLGSSPNFAFWLSLAAAAKDPSHSHHPYLAALPSKAPDPCAWTDEQRASLLGGTPLAKQVDGQRALLSSEFSRVSPHLGARGKQVTFDELLWARGVHLSRCFPRPLVEAAMLDVTHEVVASDAVDAPLRVEQGGNGPARVVWAAPGALGGAAQDAASVHDDAQPSVTRAKRAAGTNQSGAPAAGAAEDAVAAEEAAEEEVDEAAELEAHAARALEQEHWSEEAAGNLGCMLPLFDMFEHKCGHRIGWEAGCGGVRFRCRAPVERGEPLFNNYGSKGNPELLFTYGFAIKDNPLDTVDGVVVGCPAASDPALAAERRRLLDEQEVGYSVRAADGALLIGPFELQQPSSEAATDGGEGEADGKGEGEGEGEDEGGDGGEGGGVLPAELMFALSVVGMDDPEQGPMVTLDEIDLLQATLQAKLTALIPTEDSDDAAAEGTREGFVAAYRDGQRRVLRAALAEVAQMAGGAEEVDRDNAEEGDS